ncbi:hypothetical protein Hypma_014514 [Hypsizygus marmoreus]|uniref:Uncharacterized protein n=1 Tax=Hypsizygus marmoreus TaxID=39966 RepID=A0A369JH93_HYPMA|nr:hypothetical protein Hypma_014514 [Hypsizygus marmoreus]
MMRMERRSEFIISNVKFQLILCPGCMIVTSRLLDILLEDLSAVWLAFPSERISLRVHFGYTPMVSQEPETRPTLVSSALSVPIIIPTIRGYAHRAIEYWTKSNPSSAVTTKKCSAGGKDSTRSLSIRSDGVNVAHLVYYDIPAATS